MFSSALLFPAAPTSGAGGICPELDTKSRHLNHKVMNLTRHPITLVLANLESGRWSSQLPKPTIHAFSSASHCTCNRNNEVTGTTGSYVYRLALPTQSRPQSQHPHPEAVFYIACFFSNPLMGAFKAAIKVYGHEPSLTLLLADYSLISTSRTDVTFGTDNVNLFTAVSVPGSQVVFEIREQNHVGAGAPLLPPPCRWAGISFPGDEPWPAHFVFRGVLAAAQQPHIRRAVPSVGPRRLSAQYHLSVATINFEQLPRGVDIADAVSQMLATVNVVVLVNALESVAAAAVEAMQARGVTTVYHEDLLVFCEFPILEHQITSFRTTETLLANHPTSFLFLRLLLPHGGSLPLILTRLQSSTRPLNHAVRRLSLGSPASDQAHYTETASTRFSQTLDLAAFLRASPALLADGLVLVADLSTSAPPCRGPEFVRQSHGGQRKSKSESSACACQCCACEYGTLRDVLWHASGAHACVDLFYDARMEGPVAGFMDLVKVSANPLAVDPVVVQEVTQGERTRVMYLGSRPGERAGLRPLEIGLERVEVEVKVPIRRRRRRGSLAAVVLGEETDEVVGGGVGGVATYAVEVKVVHIADRSGAERQGQVDDARKNEGPVDVEE